MAKESLGQSPAVAERWARESAMPVSRKDRYVVALPFLRVFTHTANGKTHSSLNWMENAMDVDDDDPVTVYLRELATIPPLTKACRWQSPGAVPPPLLQPKLQARARGLRGHGRCPPEVRRVRSQTLTGRAAAREWRSGPMVGHDRVEHSPPHLLHQSVAIATQDSPHTSGFLRTANQLPLNLPSSDIAKPKLVAICRHVRFGERAKDSTLAMLNIVQPGTQTTNRKRPPGFNTRRISRNPRSVELPRWSMAWALTTASKL
jgi:hypothetical protein